MSVLSLAGIVFAAYLAAGRVGVVAVCLVAGMAPYKLFVMVFCMDLFQIPVYGILLEKSQWQKLMPVRFQKWISDRSRRIQQRMETSRFGMRLSTFKPLAVVAVSLLPLRGFGVFSACVLSFMMKLNRISATVSIMTGSMIGTLLSIILFYFPARWIDAFFA